MITVQRQGNAIVYRAHCDTCFTTALTGTAQQTLREYWNRCCDAGWEVPPPFPCETRGDLIRLKAWCPGCAKKACSRRVIRID